MTTKTFKVRETKFEMAHLNDHKQGEAAKTYHILKFFKNFKVYSITVIHIDKMNLFRN